LQNVDQPHRSEPRLTKSALVLACDDRFVPYTSVVARGIANHARENFSIFVISDRVSDENKKIARKFCSRIEFIEASAQLDAARIRTGGDFLTRAAYLRLLLDEILLDFDRAVYLDSDISPLVDLSPLMATVPASAPIVAMYDLSVMAGMGYAERLKMSAGSPYLNSGVMVIDLKAIRAEGMFRAARQYAVDHPERCLFVDQCALNAVLDGRWQTLDWRWNVMNFMSYRLHETPYIRHFAGNKPWGPIKRDVESVYVRQWQQELAASPWPDRFIPAAGNEALHRFLRRRWLVLEDGVKSVFYGNAETKRGNKVRLATQFPKVMARISDDANNGRLAARYPETALLRGLA
jgi:lipopolysaccharide biosynthesis glycosyltransferase